MLLSWNKVICCKLLALVLKWPACSLSWSTDWRLKERFLIRRNRTKCANFWCNHLLQATYNTTKNSLTNLSLSVRCQEAGRRKRARDCLDEKGEGRDVKVRKFAMAEPQSTAVHNLRDQRFFLHRFSLVLMMDSFHIFFTLSGLKNQWRVYVWRSFKPRALKPS